ncbi:MAG: phage portal protein [Chitinophagaceae bacterium]
MDNIFLKLGRAVNAFKGLGSATMNPTGLNPLDSISGMFDPMTGAANIISGDNYTYRFRTKEEIHKALEGCPPLAYVIMKKVLAIQNGRIFLRKKNGGNEITSGRMMKYLDLLDRPNFIQSSDVFHFQNLFQCAIYGYSLCKITKPVASEELAMLGANSVGEVWALPGELVSIKWVQKPNYAAIFSGAMQINDLMEKVYFDGIEIPKDDLILIRDSYLYRSVAIPEPRIVTASQAVNNLMTNYSGRGKLMDRPAGFITSDSGSANTGSLPASVSDIEAIQKRLEGRYGAKESKSMIMAVRSALKWQAISFSMSEMQYDILERQDTITLAELYGYPPALLGLSENQTYNNVKEAGKQLYTNTAIPEGENYMQQLTEGIVDWMDNVEYGIDFSHVPELQADKKQTSEVRKNSTIPVLQQLVSGIITYGQAMINLESTAETENKDKFFWELPDQIQSGVLQALKIQTNEQTNQTDGSGDQTNNQGQNQNG